MLNAIVGSVVMTGIGIAIGTPIGMLAGTYLAEYSGNRFAPTVRFINDVLLSAPSIIVGLFVYTILVVPTGHFSAIAGAVALAHPHDSRHGQNGGGHAAQRADETFAKASIALGAQPWRTILRVVYPAARSGLDHRDACSPSRGFPGETAPLLFTALNNQFWSVNLNGPMANLPTVIFQFAMSPYEDWQIARVDRCVDDHVVRIGSEHHRPLDRRAVRRRAARRALA